MSKKPATYGCEKCRALYEIGHETLIRLYAKQPWFNHFSTKCPQCKQTWFVWELQEETIQYIIANNVDPDDMPRYTHQDFGSELVEQAFLKATGRTKIPERELTPRQERHVEFFHYLLHKGVMPWPQGSSTGSMT